MGMSFIVEMFFIKAFHENRFNAQYNTIILYVHRKNVPEMYNKNPFALKLILK